MARSSSSFRRAKPDLKPQPRVLIICEDTKSSLTYLEEVSAYYRVRATVRVTNCGRTDPKGIVEEALRCRSKYEKIFCVVDRDGHALWDEAVRMADDDDIVELIASFPCFEFWLLLHFCFSRKPYGSHGAKSSADCCISDLQSFEEMKNYQKGGVAGLFKALLPRLDAAIASAARVLRDARETSEWNPSTKMHEVIDYIRRLE